MPARRLNGTVLAQTTKEQIARLHCLSVPTVRKRLDLFVRRSRRSMTREMVQSLVVCLAVALVLTRS